MKYFLENIVSWFLTSALAFLLATISIFVFDGFIPVLAFIAAILWTLLYIPFKYRKQLKSVADEVLETDTRGRRSKSGDDDGSIGDIIDDIGDAFDD